MCSKLYRNDYDACWTICNIYLLLLFEIGDTVFKSIHYFSWQAVVYRRGKDTLFQNQRNFTKFTNLIESSYLKLNHRFTVIHSVVVSIETFPCFQFPISWWDLTNTVLNVLRLICMELQVNILFTQEYTIDPAETCGLNKIHVHLYWNNLIWLLAYV